MTGQRAAGRCPIGRHPIGHPAVVPAGPGVTSLSVAPPLAPVAQHLAGWSEPGCRAAAERAPAAPDAATARARVGDLRLP